MPALSQKAIDFLGFAAVGVNVRISDKASFYGIDRITIGNNVRIDDFCLLSAGAGGIVIGDYVHVGVSSSLIGAGCITISDFSTLSSRVAVYSSSDDYSGEHMTNPTLPEAYTGVAHADVFIGRHVIVGSGSVILPGANLREGVAVGALSLVNTECSPFGIYAGIPARRIRERKQTLLELEKRFLENYSVLFK